jgi:hypothetical protein
VPETEALIKIQATGGSAAAAELQQVNKALGDIEQGDSKLGRALEHGGIRLAGHEVGALIQQSTGIAGTGRSLDMMFFALSSGLGPVAIALGVAAGAAAALFETFEHGEADFDKTIKSTNALAASLESASAAGKELTKDEQAFLEAHRQIAAIQLSPEIKKLEDAVIKADDAYAKIKVRQGAVRAEVYNMGQETPAAVQRWFEYTSQLNHAKESAAQLHIELAKLRGTEVKPAKPPDFKEKDNELRRFWEAMDREAIAGEKVQADAARKTEQEWRQALSGVNSVIGSSLVNVIGHANRLKDEAHAMGEALVRAFEEAAIKAALLKIELIAIDALTGGIGGMTTWIGPAGSFSAAPIPHLATGGVIPGRVRGEAVLMVGHAGETVTANDGKGGGTGAQQGGDGDTHIHLHAGVFAGLRDLERTQRSGIRTGGRLGLG